MQLGIVGKPNVGKSTFFNAATEAHAEIANYPFTTIEANRGVMYIRKPCPCKDFKVTCIPHNSKCSNGTRFVPIEVNFLMIYDKPMPLYILLMHLAVLMRKEILVESEHMIL